LRKLILFCALPVFVFLAANIELNAQPEFDQAADNPYLNFAHGIVGTAIGETAALPVDIYVNGVKKLKKIKFGKVKGTKKVTSGNATVEIYRTGEGPTNGNTPLGDIDIVLKPYENATIAAYLDNQQNIVVQKFTNDLSPVGNSEKCRVIIHNLGVGPLEAYLENSKGYEGHPFTRAELTEPGDKFTFEVANKILYEPNKGESLAWTLGVTEGGQYFVTIYKKSLAIKASRAILVYLIGATSDKSFTVVKKLTKLQ